jgi:hypothetical protein
MQRKKKIRDEGLKELRMWNYVVRRQKTEIRNK